jgi:hypothetical protein
VTNGAGTVTNANITNVSVNCVTTLKVTLLGGGPTETDPLTGVRVIRHDTISGAVLGDKLTDAQGVADFGTIGVPRTTVSLIDPDGDGDKDIFTLVSIPTGDVRLNLGNSSTSTQATVDVTLTNLPAESTQANLLTDNYGSQYTFVSGSIADFTGLKVNRLQSDSMFSLMGVAQDNNSMPLGCGSLLDLDPTVVNNNTNQTFAVNVSPVSILFSASEPVYTDSVEILRKGAIFRNSLGTSPLAFSGTLNVCSLPEADGFAISFYTPHTATSSPKKITKISPKLPGSLNITFPSLSIDSLSRSADGKTISWTRSGADLGKVYAAYAGVIWVSGGIDHWWGFIGDPATNTSFTIPALPADLSDYLPPATTGNIFVALHGQDDVNGFDDFVQKLSAANGDFDVLLLGGTEFFSVDRFTP